mmetsp:Transcript_79701/g.247287  ORF Transcript_79701/g.247287 Transcript_79701/m.247287 type:complete len:210 (-) Transcript_79701:99-728(-)
MARVREELGVEFKVVWHPYFLDPSLPLEGLTRRANYRRRGMDDARLEKMERSMAKLFHAEGLQYSADGATGSTMDSHRLASWTFTKYGAEAQHRFVSALFHRHFCEGQSPSDSTALLGAAEDAGLDISAARGLLESDLGRQRVIDAAQEVAPLVTGVPHYFLAVEGTVSESRPRGVISQVPGAQDKETFVLVLRALVRKAQESSGTAKL